MKRNKGRKIVLHQFSKCRFACFENQHSRSTNGKMHNYHSHGYYTRMLHAILNKSSKQHPHKTTAVGPLTSYLTNYLRQTREAGMNSLVTFSCELPYMHTCCPTSLEDLVIGMDGKRDSWESLLLAESDKLNIF